MFNTILQNFHLEKVLWIIKSKIQYMFLTGLIVGVLAGGVGLMTNESVYAATISFYVYSNPDYINDNGVNLSSTELTQASSLLQSYMQILKSKTFLTSVITETGLDEYGYTVSYLSKNISASAVSNTAVFKVTVYDANPVVAMEIANTIGELAPSEIIRIVKAGGIEVLDAADLPTSPYSSTSVTLFIIGGFVVGFGLMMIWLLLKYIMDTTVRRTYEITDLFEIPILGTVPLVKETKKFKGYGLEKGPQLTEESPFILKEAYNDIRSNLLFIAKGEKCPVYVIASADQIEGKSLNTINLAKAFAQGGKRVLLIDSDMRNSYLTSTLGYPDDTTGLCQYLANLSDNVNINNINDNFDVIFAGGKPVNQAELLVSDKWYSLIEDLKNQYDIIFVDTAALGVYSDACSLANIATAYVLVVRENVTHYERTEMVVMKLEPLDANICGIIYNGIALDSDDYNYKEYVRKNMTNGSKKDKNVTSDKKAEK